MAHFAEINEEGIVQKVIVVSDDDCKDLEGNESEAVGSAFCNNLLGGIWKQTSYNGNIRKNYATPGSFYDERLDAFIPIKPYSKWVLNEESNRSKSSNSPFFGKKLIGKVKLVYNNGQYIIF